MIRIINNIKEKIYKNDWQAWKDASIKQRLFYVIVVIATGLCLVNSIETFLITDSFALSVFMIATLIVVVLGMWLSLIKRKIKIASFLIFVVLNLVVYPCVFYMEGGMQSGSVMWFLLGYFYVFLMFDGALFWICLIATIGCDIFVYVHAYLHPGFVKPPLSRFTGTFDSIFSLIIIGIFVGILLRVQMHLYDEARKLAEHRAEELEKNARSRNNLFAGMSHEIRTPINTIMGLNELIMRSDADETIKEYSNDIDSATRMLLSLVNDILDFSKIEINKLEIIPMEYSSKSMFQKLYDMILIQASKKNLQLKMNIDTLFPSVLYGDEKRLIQVVLNLLNNAVKYTDSGTITLEATGDKDDDGTYQMRISVADTGIGIKKEDISRIYDSFQRVDERNNTWIEGSGLGLSIVKQLVELMGGTVKVDSIYRKGSVFTVTIPQKIVEHTPVGLIVFGTDEERKKYQYHQKFEAPEARVLIVDDNRMNTIVTSRLLAATRMQIYSVGSGKECLEITKQKFFHVILMDYMMTEMNGIETMKEIRKQENGLCKNTPIIALTAASKEEAEAADVEVGFDAYLEKPVRSEQLEGEILNLLPKEIVSYRQDKNIYSENGESNSGVLRRKRKVRITTDCIADLPKELLEKYDIHVQNLYIRTEKGRFLDSVEIDSDNMSQYITAEDVYTDSCSVEEFENFFADNLTDAVDIIHISMASNTGTTYSRAVEAAKGFDYVHVYDSGHISVGEGLLVVEAARLASFGKSVEEVIAALDEYRPKIDSGFLVEGAEMLSRQGYTNRGLVKITNVLKLHPVLRMRHRSVFVDGFLTGEKENLWRKYVGLRLRKERQISQRVVMISFAGCTSNQRKVVLDEVEKRIPFENIIVCKSCFSNALASGAGTFGIAFFEKD
ncbi:MAG: DegV family EDD domain-containing protein [Lachnospiraceae bacterium]|nr:DegV family EDD domain-containing protein [Lachnospiraceae bacterium]